jgi:hypothetical protein
MNVVVMSVGIILSAAVTDMNACSGQPITPPQPVITQGEACALDIIEDTTQAVTAALVIKTAADCGVAVVDIYNWVTALINGMPDAGALPTILRRGKLIPRDVYVNNLQQWLQAVAVAQKAGAK